MKIQTSPLFSTSQPLIIAGPCSAENMLQTLTTARSLARAGVNIYRAGVWKPRTHPGGFEGMGVAALKWLRAVKEETGMQIATEVGCCSHTRMALEADVDILWIGARTTASPFAVQEIAEQLRGTDKTILVKNPVSADLELWIGAIERLYNCGIRRIAAIHRGFKSNGEQIYRNTPHWEIAEELRRRIPGLPVICDPSHMGGRRDLIEPLSAQALEKGFDGLMIESHCDPDNALTDASQQLTPEDLASLMQRLHGMRKN